MNREREREREREIKISAADHGGDDSSDGRPLRRGPEDDDAVCGQTPDDDGDGHK